MFLPHEPHNIITAIFTNYLYTLEWSIGPPHLKNMDKIAFGEAVVRSFMQ